MSRVPAGFTVAGVAKMEADPGKTQIVFDEKMPGFGVRIEPSGVKAWIVEFRDPGAGGKGQKRRQTIGRVGKVTLDDAQKAARAIFGDLARGRDLHAEAVEKKRGALFDAVAIDFLVHVKRVRKQATHDTYERIIEAHLKPPFGSRVMKTIARADLRRVHAEISDKAPIAANRAVAVFSTIWNFAAKDDLVTPGANPATGLTKNAERARERFLTGDELDRLLDALDLAERDGLPWKPARALPARRARHQPLRRATRVSPYLTGAIRLLLLTGARLREILGLRWAEIDAERGLAFLPDSKTGRKPLVLNSAALAEIERLRNIKENDFVVGGGSRGKPRADIRKPWDAVTRHAGLDGFRIHDLRHSAASFAVGAGHSLPAIGGVLGHKKSSTTERYAHLQVGPVRAAAESIAGVYDAARRRRDVQSE